jgi:serine/threonine protein kinase
LADFELKNVIGRGGFGKVLLIQHKANRDEVYAMKAMDK